MKKFSVICFWPDEGDKNQAFRITTAVTVSLRSGNIIHHNKELRKTANVADIEDTSLTTDSSNDDVNIRVTSAYLCQNGDVGVRKSTKTTPVLSYKAYYCAKHNAILARLIVQELKTSRVFRHNFVCYVTSRWQQMECQEIQKNASPQNTSITLPILIIMALQWPSMYILDYKWNYRICNLVVRTLQLADAMNWLNTLGGGYSALGDYCKQHAEHAGHISCRQLCIAVEMGDPSTVIRCHLYYALSLMQTGRLRESKYTIRWCYKKAQSLIVSDLQLLAMCKGMWSRLRYKYMQRKTAPTLS